MRPAALGPFDYEREAYTPSLWMVEGLTSYYGPLFVHRAGVSTREEYLQALSGQIESLQTTPGRLVQPVADASHDAWIKFYRPNENSRNTTISYYTKGAVIGFLLDARVREATGWTAQPGRRVEGRLRPLFRGRAASGRASSRRWRPRSPASIWATGSTGRSVPQTSSTTSRPSTGSGSSSRPARGPTGTPRRRPGSASPRGRTAAGCWSPGCPAGPRATRPGSTWATRSWRSTTTGCGPGDGGSASTSTGRATRSRLLIARRDRLAAARRALRRTSFRELATAARGVAFPRTDGTSRRLARPEVRAVENGWSRPLPRRRKVSTPGSSRRLRLGTA